MSPWESKKSFGLTRSPEVMHLFVLMHVAQDPFGVRCAETLHLNFKILSRTRKRLPFGHGSRR